MVVEIKADIQDTIRSQAESLGLNAEDYVNNVLLLSLAPAHMVHRILSFVENEIYPLSLKSYENTVAIRHQILSLHADASNADRAIAISKEATELAQEVTYGIDEKEENV